MSHTASRVWVSDEAQERDRYFKFLGNKHLVAPFSPFLPDTWKDWLAQRLAMKEAYSKYLKHKLAVSEECRKKGQKVKVTPLLNGKKFKDNFGAVVATQTVFVRWYEPSDERAEPPWPTYEEFKHEGDDRERSRYKRQLPLPRKPGNSTVNWKQRQMQDPYEFDAPSDPRSPESRRAIRHEPTMTHYIGKELLNELNMSGSK